MTTYAARIKEWVDISQDSRWQHGQLMGREYPANPKKIFIHGILIGTDSRGVVCHVTAFHNSDWTVYTDTRLPEFISEKLGVDVHWSEQGLQSNKLADFDVATTTIDKLLETVTVPFEVIGEDD